MELSKSAAHAVLAMAYLSRRSGDGLTQARQVANHLSLPIDSVLKILQSLSRRGLIHSQLGRSGGYRLRLAARHVSLRQVIEVIDGPIVAEVPIDRRPADPAAQRLCDICQQAARQTRQLLEAVTIAALIQEG